MNEGYLALHISDKDAEMRDSLAKQHIEDIKIAMKENPHKWGFYENWEQAIINTDYHHRVVESCMRQHQATDFLINSYIAGKPVSINELFYFLGRIEILYDYFIKTIKKEGGEVAVKELEENLRHGLSGGEKGYASKDSLVGMELIKRRIDVGGKRVYFVSIDKIISKAKEQKVSDAKQKQISKYKGIGRIGLFINQQPFRGEVLITYEDIIRSLQQE